MSVYLRVMKMLEHTGVKTSGQHAVIIGRSDIVGKPMGALLIQRGADAKHDKDHLTPL